MMNPKTDRVRDEKYRKSAREQPCMVCGSMGTTVLAHINIAGNFGMGLKAGDDESLFLCHEHHTDLDTSSNRAEWLVRFVLLPDRRRAYRLWRADKDYRERATGFEDPIF